MTTAATAAADTITDDASVRVAEVVNEDNDDDDDDNGGVAWLILFDDGVMLLSQLQLHDEYGIEWNTCSSIFRERAIVLCTGF